MSEDKDLSGCLDKEKDKEEIKANDNKKYLPKEKGFDGTEVAFPLERFEEQLKKLRTRGFEAFESGVLPMSNSERNMRLQFQTLFEGPDVYCDDTWTIDPTHSAVKDGTLNTVNGFGRLEVDPYPFCLQIFWDGSGHDHAEVPSWGDHKFRVQELWNMQLRPDVVRMKQVRLQLRGAKACGTPLYNPVERDQHCTRQVEDGKDSEGKTKYKTESYTIHWNYTSGTVSIKGDFGENEFEQGFDVSMSYNDGKSMFDRQAHLNWILNSDCAPMF